MSTTINVICYKSKVLKNNEHPLMLRVCKDRKMKYLSLGISVPFNFWDFEKQKPKPNCPNKEQLETLISNKIKSFSSQIMEFKAMDKEFTASTLMEKVSNPIKRKTVHDFFMEEIERLINEKRTNYALSHRHLYNSLLKFNKHLDIYFTDIDIAWLRKYEAYLRNQNLSENTIGIRFRTLRVLYNTAIELNTVKSEHYPFNSFKVSRMTQKTAKRAISKSDVYKVITYKSETAMPYSELAIDIFSFSYFSGGINFVDIAHLTTDNIIDNQLVYVRKKTKKVIRLPIQSKAFEIIQKYSKHNNLYLFPILSDFHKTEQQKHNRVRKVISKVNKHLKNIGKELNLPIDLTTYVARHSYATVLKRAGVSTSIISESLGHSSEKITQIYLDSFENSQIDEAMKNLL